MCLREKRRKKVDRHVRAFLRRCQKGGQTFCPLSERKAIVSVHKFTNSQVLPRNLGFTVGIIPVLQHCKAASGTLISCVFLSCLARRSTVFEKCRTA